MDRPGYGRLPNGRKAGFTASGGAASERKC